MTVSRRSHRRVGTRAVLVAGLMLVGGVGWGGLGDHAAFASSGYCPKGTGVTVVVDFGPLGGGTAVGCDPDGAGKPASTVVPAAGFSLVYVNGQAFVCRIDGKPDASQEGCQRTPPPDAYWGLFHSDGTSGSWSYSSVGVTGLKVGAGGFIGWRFQDGGSRDNPGVKPVAPGGSSPEPTPTPKATATPSTKSTPKSTPKSSPSANRSSQPTTTADPSTGAAGTASSTSQATPTAGGAAVSNQAGDPAETTPTVAATPSPLVEGGAPAVSEKAAQGPAGAASTGAGGGPLTWVAAGTVLALGAGAGAVAWQRRR